MLGVYSFPSISQNSRTCNFPMGGHFILSKRKCPQNELHSLPLFLCFILVIEKNYQNSLSYLFHIFDYFCSRLIANVWFTNLEQRLLKSYWFLSGILFLQPSTPLIYPCRFFGYLLLYRNGPIPFRVRFMCKSSPCCLSLCYFRWFIIWGWNDGCNFIKSFICNTLCIFHGKSSPHLM